jgi:hypothetical protein
MWHPVLADGALYFVVLAIERAMVLGHAYACLPTLTWARRIPIFNHEATAFGECWAHSGDKLSLASPPLHMYLAPT